jgi:asparagine N-glycosylation enzyme membrane subunit Stt3
MVLSICAILASIVMIIFAALITNSDIITQVGKEDASVSDAADRVFIVLLIFSLTTMLIGGLGFCFKCVKNRCFAFIYGLILLPTWLAVLIIGFIATAAATVSKEALATSCTNLEAQTTYSSSFNTNIGG